MVEIPDTDGELISDKLIEMITEQITELESQYQLQARGAEDGSQGGVIATTTEDRDFRFHLPEVKSVATWLSLPIFGQP